MIPIEYNKPDWNTIRSEYIGGGISYRQIAKKYSIPFGTVRHRAQVENWVKEREIAEHKINTISAQKTAEVAADNAVIAARIKRKMLLRLEKEFDALPELTGSEMFMNQLSYEYEEKSNRIKKRTDGGKTYKLSDFARMLKDLTEDMPKAEIDKADTGRNSLLEALELATKPQTLIEDVPENAEFEAEAEG